MWVRFLSYDINGVIHNRKNKKCDLNFIKMKYFSANDTVKRMGTQALDWERDLHITHLTKDLYRKTYKELLKFNTKK